MRRLFTLPILGLLLALVGCAGQKTMVKALPPAVSDPAAFPAEQDYRVVAVVENGQPRALAPGTTVSLSFNRVTTEMFALSIDGCNSHYLEVDLSGGRLALHRSIGATQKGCYGAEGDQDAWFVDLVSDSPSWTLRGEVLILAVDRTWVRLVATAPPPERQ